MKIESIPEVNQVEINLTFDPPWDQSMMSDEARLELGMM
jgi:metal-sulfur cluster biosynthetic enzyme